MLLRPETFRRLCLARDLLHEVRDDRLTLRDVAREVGLSPFHFIRQFEAVFGLTPHQYRIGARLDLARSLLARGELSVTEVCMHLGFSSLGSFSASFTRRVGESPSAYRRRVRTVARVPGLVTRPRVPGCLGLMTLLPVAALRNSREA